jgi:hypothetical protein
MAEMHAFDGRCGSHRFHNGVDVGEAAAGNDGYLGLIGRGRPGGVEPAPAVVEIKAGMMAQGLQVGGRGARRARRFWKIPAPIHIRIGAVAGRVFGECVPDVMLQ